MSKAELSPEQTKRISLPDTEKEIYDTCTEVADMLCKKNRSYGDSALNPRRIFSKADSIAGLLVRIDDKLNRLMQGTDEFQEDTEADLLGYLILLRIARKRQRATVMSAGKPTGQIGEEI